MSRFLKSWKRLQPHIGVLCIMGMIAGFLWARALLSMAMMVAFANALHPHTFKKYWQQWKVNRFAIVCFILFLIYLISGFWSLDEEAWWKGVVTIVPLAFLPFAFLAVPFKNYKAQRVMVAFLLLTEIIVIIYSMTLFLTHLSFYIHGYTMSHSIPTNKYDDHIRFSLALVGSVVMILYYLFENKKVFVKKIGRGFLWFSGILFCLYLHILAAKTGLLALYFVLIAFVIYRLIKRKASIGSYVFIIAVIIAAPVLLYFLVPTFREKAQYVQTEITDTFQKGTLNYNYSDIGRLISYKMAWKVWEKHKLLGTGAGDLRDKINEAYAENRPQVPPKYRLVPHNQYIYSFLAFGPFLGLILVWLSWTSVFSQNKPKFYGQITALVMIFAMLVEAMLQVQFGVFLYLFFILYWQGVHHKIKKAT